MPARAPALGARRVALGADADSLGINEGAIAMIISKSQDLAKQGPFLRIATIKRPWRRSARMLIRWGSMRERSL